MERLVSGLRRKLSSGWIRFDLLIIAPVYSRPRIQCVVDGHKHNQVEIKKTILDETRVGTRAFACDDDVIVRDGSDSGQTQAPA